MLSVMLCKLLAHANKSHDFPNDLHTCGTMRFCLYLTLQMIRGFLCLAAIQKLSYLVLREFS